jgi:hypothetical protein
MIAPKPSLVLLPSLTSCCIAANPCPLSKRPLTELNLPFHHSYSTIAFATSLDQGKQPGVEYNLKGLSSADITFNMFNALGTICFAYGGHNVVLEIQVRCSRLGFICVHFVSVAWARAFKV